MPPYQIVVSDSSVILDPAKTRLIEATLALPFAFVIPDVILDQELIDLGTYSPTDLVRLGFKIGTLDGKGIAAAMAHYGRNASRLSFNDCVALTYAEQHACVLMTGDGPLRTLAQAQGRSARSSLGGGAHCRPADLPHGSADRRLAAASS